MDVGYTRTTYERIASLAGCERTLVQYHVPRKDGLAVGFLIDLLRAIEQVLEDEPLAARSDVLAYRFALAQIYFAALALPRMKPFALGALGSRTVIEGVLAEDVAWNLAYLDPPEDARARIVADSIFAVGGGYELLYHRLTNGIPAQPSDLAARVLIGSLPGNSTDKRTLAEELVAGPIETTRLRRLAETALTIVRPRCD
jgi:AcrR family transcriptional regulator